MTHGRAYALLLLVTVLWAGNFPFGKLALTELGPLTLTATRALLAAPLLVVAARILYGPLPAFSRADRWAFALVSLTGLVCNTTVWYWGLRYTSPINAGILGAGAPVLVAIAGALWLRDPLARRHYAGFGLTLGAVLLTISHGSLDILRTLSFNKGDLIILGSQWAWIAYSLLGRANTSRLPSLTLQAGAHVVSAVVLVPLALLERPWASLTEASMVGWGVILYAAGPLTVGHVLYYKGVSVVGAGRAAIFMNLIPFLVIGLSWLFLGERVYWYHLVGATAAIAGVALATSK
jgi:drug/metabolite transporter (DMT)-like permease